jgi:type I restriction-modification system DNA methylase subunit
MYSAICAELRKSDVPERNKESLVKGYEFITTNPSINNPSAEVKKYVTDLISNCDERINGFMVTHKYIDTISQFYVEFLRYANNDKGLGIVLTPPHITELFCELAQVDKDSVVLDNCAGTGGFLVSAMKKMLENANNDIAKEQHIKDKQLIGIEYDEEIYTLLISNMIVHRDGRTNILRDDCFNVVAEELKERFHPTVGLLNPPYKNKSKGTEELEFVLNNLSMLEKGGRCVAIMPISCVNDVSGKSYLLKRKILQEHTLEAVLSLPEELFYNSNVNTVTCAVVLTAHIPQPANKKTWFGYCHNDGFVKRKNKGRIDANHTWQQIKDQWVSAYMNREVIPEFSVMKQVTAKDEWCAEAYLDTQYDRLTEEDFLDTVKNFYLFNIKSAEENITDGED